MSNLVSPTLADRATPENTVSVGAWVLYPEGTAPGQRYRIEQWQPHLKGAGIGVEYYSFADQRLWQRLHRPGGASGKAWGVARGFVRRARHLLDVPRHDAIYLSRAAALVGPAIFERVMNRMGRPIIFDFDDAIYLVHTAEANRHWGWLKFAGKTATLCRLASHVVVGNAALAAYARQYNKAVTIIPSSVDTLSYCPHSSPRSGGPIIVGWTGSTTSQTYLEQFVPVLRQLIARRHVEIRVHSDREPALPGVPYVWRPWSAETELEELRQFDIGIMPMPDDAWATGKCAMKALLYMALGIPAVCAAVGTNCEVIQHGENGLLAHTPDEWLTHLESLIDDPHYRNRLGVAGRQTVEQHYSMERCAALFTKVVRQVVS